MTDRLVDTRRVQPLRSAIRYPLSCGHSTLAPEKTPIQLAAYPDEFCPKCQCSRKIRRRKVRTGLHI